MKGIIVVKDGKPFTTSLILSERIKVEHRAVLNLIRKYKHRKIFQTSAFEMQKLKTKGREAEYYFLTESQAIFILTLMRNSEKVLDFKESLVNAFMEYRYHYLYSLQVKGTPEHVEARNKSKIVRLEETDVIKQFVNYATDQGSKNARMYYISISKLENQALFFIEHKVKNVRELLDFKQLALLQTADIIVCQALKEGMDLNMPYKAIYQLVKERLEQYSRITPKSPLAFLPALEN
jgi:phage regulator Rha-like protein